MFAAVEPKFEAALEITRPSLVHLGATADAIEAWADSERLEFYGTERATAGERRAEP